MSTFQQALAVIAMIWLAIVLLRFRRSTLILIIGLFVLGILTIVGAATSRLTLEELGLDVPNSWPRTIAITLGWLALMLAYSPVADKLASAWFQEKPNLEAFRALQESRAKLIAGIVVAWILGGVLEELTLRGIILRTVESSLVGAIGPTTAVGVAIIAAAAGASVMHLYQGMRAVLIITQLSVLFGLLFVLTDHDLYAVMLCHGLYDTIAFIRFANKSSKYSNLDGDKVGAAPAIASES